MNQTYTIDDGFDELFAVADNLYENLKRALVSAEMKTMEHGDIEERVAGDGLEILRQLVQVHFDVRAEEEVRRESVTGSDLYYSYSVRKASEKGLPVPLSS